MVNPALTIDTFCNGRIKVAQDLMGYRFAIDAVILAHHVDPHPGDKILDLGTGCGIIPLILAFRQPETTICGVEIQKSMAEIADRNVDENRMRDRIRILRSDMKTLTKERIHGPADLVVTNPPYRPASSGRINPNKERALARHEIAITLEDLLEVAHRLLKSRGRFTAIYPAQRTTDLLSCMRRAAIEPKRLRMVHSRIETEAKLVLVDGRKGGRRGICIDPPLVIYAAKGEYMPAMKEMFNPKPAFSNGLKVFRQ